MGRRVLARRKKRAASKSSGAISFKHPPLDEVVCGVRFNPPLDLKIPLLGLLWEKVRRTHPTIEQQPPIAPGGALVTDTTTGLPIPRLWFINKTDDELIQVQRDLLYFNWRRRGDEYPRIGRVFDGFNMAFEKLNELVQEQEIAPVVIAGQELTYINQIPQGEAWKEFSDLGKLFPHLANTTARTRFLPIPTSVSWQGRFALPEGRGNLEARLMPAMRKESGESILTFQLTATCNESPESHDELHAWFRLAHEWIVNAFVDLTSEDVQRDLWGRQ